MLPQNHPRGVILSADLPAVFGSTIPDEDPSEGLKDELRHKDYQDVWKYFPNFRMPVEQEESLVGVRSKLGHCCQDISIIKASIHSAAQCCSLTRIHTF